MFPLMRVQIISKVFAFDNPRRERETETERDRERQRDRERIRERDRQTDKERERGETKREGLTQNERCTRSTLDTILNDNCLTAGFPEQAAAANLLTADQ